MKFWKKCTALCLALLLTVPMALTACGEAPNNGGDDTNNGVNNPDNGGDNPDNGGNNPDNGGDNSDNSGDKPDNGGNNPDNDVDNPDNGGNNPDNGGDNPDNGGDNPDNGGDNPDNGGNNPDNGGNNPDNGGDNPDNGGNNPDNGGDNGGNNDQSEITFEQFTYNQSNPDPAGSAYNRYEGKEGYYEIALKAGSTKYYSFSASQTGTYALKTLEQKNGFTIERCEASEHYINETETYPATLQADGTLISEAICTETYFNEYWRATYKITSNIDDVIQVRFERIGDAPREPQRIVTDITAKEIVGKAQDPTIEEVAVEIPWLNSDNPSYFYDEDYEMTFTDLTTGEEKTAKGFYRYGKETDVNAPVIWVAITSTPTRYFEGDSFSTLLSPNLVLQTGTDATTGDYLLNNYVDFIMNNGGVRDSITGLPITEPGDEKKLCYMNVVNSDGLFPVNQELFEFLNLYTKATPPILGDDVNIEKENFWLAPCYYYDERIPGSEEYPIVLETGETTVSAGMTTKYYKIESDSAKQFTLTGSAGLIVRVNGKNHGVDGSGFTLTLDVPVGGIVLELKSATQNDYTVTVTEITA